MTRHLKDMWSEDPTDCPKCGQPHVARNGAPACAGHRKSDGKACTNYPIHDAKVCRKYGGAAGQVRAAAERRGAEARARRALEAFGEPAEDVGDPGEVLVGLIEVSAGLVIFYREQVRDLQPDALVWGVAKTKASAAGSMLLTFGRTGMEDDEDQGVGLTDFGSVPSSEVESKAAVSVWLQLYDRERDRLALAIAALKAGVQERQVRLAEQQGEMTAATIRAVLADLSLSIEQQAKVAEVVPRHLRLLHGGAA